MSKTRTCPGPPEHEFTYPGGRGRPPIYCAEHKPVKPAAKDPTKHLVGSRTDDDPVRDKRDENNPFIKKTREKSSNPFIDKAKKLERLAEDLEAGTRTAAEDEATLAKAADDWDEQDDKKTQDSAKMERAREGKSKKANEQSRQRQADLEREFAEIDERVKACYDEYERIFAKAKKSDDAKLWRQLDSAQNSAVNASARKRFLYDYFDKNNVKPIERKTYWDDPASDNDHPEKEFEGKVCECCERAQEPGEKGWVVDPNEGVDLCGDCARELGAIDPDYAGLVEEDSEDDPGYTDLLAKPEQFDDAHADFSEIIESELG